MKKEQLDNYYENVFIGDRSIFAITLPLTVVQKTLFNSGMEVVNEKFDMTHSQVDVLFTLYFANNTMTPTELYSATIFSSGGMTKLLKGLEENEFISRVPCAYDKRSMLVKIEQKGKSAVEELIQDFLKIDNEFFEVLDEDEKKQLTHILKKLVYNIFKQNNSKIKGEE